MNWIKPDWPAPAHVHAAVTLRGGGVSTGNYHSLNPAAHVGDDPAHVAANRQLIRDRLQLPAEPVWLQQVHGSDAVRADEARGLPVADASYSARPGTVCAVLTADCLPVLFSGDGGRVVAAAHAGWRGLLAGILDHTVAAMQSRQVMAWLGPAIGPDNFEVGAEVRDAFVAAAAVNASAFRALPTGKWLADLYALARIRLHGLGVADIYGGGLCTVAEPERFYSYRRDGGATGRMASLIWSD